MITRQQLLANGRLVSLPNFLVLSYTLFLAGFFYIPNAVDLYKFYVVALFLPGLFITPRTFSSLRGNGLFYAILLYIGYMVISSFWSANFSITYLWDASRLGAYTVVFLLVTVFIRDRDPALFDSIIMFICLLAAIAAVASVFIWYSENPFPRSRLVGIGTLRNPNPSSFAYGFFCFMSCYYALSSESARCRFVFMATCAVLVVFVALTQSRGGALATLASILVLLFHKRSHQHFITVIMLLTLLATSIYLLAPPELLSLQITRGLPRRPDIWKTVLDQVSNAPIFGNGFYKEILLDHQGKPAIANFAHNALLATARDGGLIGLALHMSILATAVYQTFKAKSENITALYLSLLLFGFICMSFDSDQLLSRPKMLWIIFWLPLALILSTDRNPQKAVARKVPDEA